MKRNFYVLLAVMLLVPMGIFSQTYQEMWKQVEKALDKDLPKTAMEHLQKIEAKAQKERAYGQLLRATLSYARQQSRIAPDSLPPAVVRLEKEAEATQDVALKAVYHTVLSKIYEDNGRTLGEESADKAAKYRQQAMLHPEALAKVKAEGYEPFVIKGKDSKTYYGDDLLNVVGRSLEAWQWLHEYYSKTGNRRAACLTGVEAFDDKASLDSLAVVYGDLPEACEIAIKRLGMMDESDAAAVKERITYLRESLKKWGSWQRANRLRNEETDMTRPTFTAAMPHRVAMPQERQTVKLTSLRNIETLTMQVYGTNLKGDTELNPDIEKDYKKMKSHLTLRADLTRTLHFSGHQDYESFEDSVELPALEPGVYMIEWSSPQTETSRKLYFVSGVRLMAQAMPEQQMRYVVVDARTGQPIPKATVRLKYRGGWKQEAKTDALTCNDEGELMCDFSERTPSEVMAYTKSDEYNPPMSAGGRYTYYSREYTSEHTNVFTDRSIYRPGQTVHVAAIVWKEQSALDNVAVENKRVHVELRDANYKVVAEQWVTTDRYGKCATELTLPKGLLNGRFTVRANNTSTTISVEEYKRPTFQVEFDEYKASYQQGDTVRAKGKAMSYAGVPVQGAKVKYTVSRQVAFWWLTYSWYWEGGYFGNGRTKEVVKEGEAVTGDDGTFEVEMPMTLPEDDGKYPMYYSFVAETEVTDVAGETHHGSMSLPLGTKATALTCSMPQKVRSDQMPQVTFSRRNAAGKEIEGQVKYRVDGGKWQECPANEAQPTAPWKLKSGEHRLEATCGDDSVDMTFVVFGLDDTKPATTTHDWFYVSESQFPNDGTPVTLQVGASDPDLHIVYAIYAADQIIERGVVKKSGELLNRKLKYKEEYGNGLLLSYAWVKDGVCYSHQQTIKRPMPDKKLRLTWETFRDRLTPGQQEEWRLKVVNPDGTPADASLMAVLYDKSLDQIKMHNWSFVPTNYLPQPSTIWQFRTTGKLSWGASQAYKTPLDYKNLDFSRFDESILPSAYIAYGRAYGSGRLMRAKAVEDTGMMVMEEAPAMAMASNDAVELSAVAEKKETKVFDAVETGTETTEEQHEDNVQVRENLDETAFCYPTLMTDEKGQVVMTFTLPESLTTWRFMGIANTQQMMYGRIEGEAVAQKDVMVQPNVPRFVRMGDEAQISTRIFNTGEKAVAGNARLQLIDPETNKVVKEQSVPFSVEAGKTGSATFNVQCSTFNVSLLICKISAVGDGFSDGEQHYLPVLPDKEYVTKTVPYTQHEPGVKTIDLTKLFPQGTTQQKLTIEYTNNPAWLMVQSLPTLGQPCEHSAIDQAASYYSNLLAKTLLNQSPQVKTTFKLWQQEEAQATLTSQLEKNQELKDLVLSETPWVWAADRESEQKQRLSDFFDENGISNRLTTALEKLQKLQNGDGSFSWYPGMQGSTYITVAVEEMLVRLNRMTGTQNATKQMEDKAFKFIGNEIVDMVKEMKKQEKKGRKPSFPSFTALRWLYLCALDGRKLPSDVQAANDYLLPLLKKDIQRQTIYEKALSAIILSKNGETRKATEYVQSLKEYTVFTEEMGRYYDTPRAGYSWYDYKIPTEVAAIEAIQMVTPNDVQTVDEMRRWLLQEKRTQMWDTPINSVNAIWAFLNGDATTLTTTQPATVLAVDGTPVDAPKATAGIGYVKTAMTDPIGKTFTATKTSEGTSWGAVYAQFFQKTSEVEQSNGGITVKREVLVAGKPQAAAALKVGDRIKVRITIECSRDLDFVQVSDRRAACMEPVKQLSGYQQGAYVSPKDCATNYFYYGLSKGKHQIETEYYIDRAGKYESGTCTVQCAYAPEYRATAPSMTFNVKE